MKKILIGIGVSILSLLVLVFLGAHREVPSPITYGASFSKLHSDELGLDWKKVYQALLDDLHIKHFRLSAHWPMVEPSRNDYNFVELDYQIREAAKRDASVILAVGKKTPGWPECHIPDWAKTLSRDEQQKEILEYVAAVVNRYKNDSNIRYWQVENEPFLNFARHICGEPDEHFIQEEIALVRSLDSRPILLTDGGEFGLWYKARKYADIFGSTMYVYVYTRHIGYWRYPVDGWFFRLKQNLLDLVEEKPSISVEVGLEPWLHQAIVETPLEEQLERMSMKRFEEVLSIAERSGFSEHYLWGVEWWYYMKERGYPEFWDRAKRQYSSEI